MSPTISQLEAEKGLVVAPGEQVARPQPGTTDVATPSAGPWWIAEARGPHRKLCFHEIRSPEGHTVASTWAEPHIANARLIAAAPDLLALAYLIRALADDVGLDGPIAKQARAAIAKAEGNAR